MVSGMLKAHDRLWLVLAALPAILSIGGGAHIITLAQQVNQGPEFADINEFFDGIQEDRTKVTWAHAVNSRAALEKALADKTMMLEADVVIGTVTNSTIEEPIMAHPPNKTSDMSLKVFLKEVDNAVASGKKKGVKLDFKATDAFNKSVGVLKEHKFQKPFPMWLNADVVSGPVDADPATISPKVFMNTSRDNFRTAALSLSWTSNKPTMQQSTSCYTQSQLREMVRVVKKAGLETADNVTLAVRAVYGARCVEQLNKLLTEELTNATLTIWSSDGDEKFVSIKQLKELIEKVKKDRIYLDLPQAMIADLNKPSSSNRIGSFAALIVLSLAVALWRLQ